MSTNKNLFKEAIADAKAVREAALANAKAALEEALTPKLQSMLAAKLNEMEELEEGSYEEDGDMKKEGFASSHDENSDANLDFNLEEDESLEEEFDLSEILAELNEDENLEERRKSKNEDDEDDEEKDEKKKKLKEGEDEEEEEEESENVADMTIDDLKALIADIVAQEMGGEEGGEEAGEEMPAVSGDEEGSDDSVPLDEEEINLEELLAELDELEENETLEETPEDVQKAREFQAAQAYAKTMGQQFDQKAYNQNRAGYMQNMIKKATANQGGPAGFYREGKQEMEETLDTIQTLRNELNEVNLLNAKLLYVNKIFKAKNLSESQKLQVIASFDKATTAKEAKVVYESLNATLTANTAKRQIKESLGFASKAAGVAPKKAIVESNDVIARMQKLANIK